MTIAVIIVRYFSLRIATRIEINLHQKSHVKAHASSERNKAIYLLKIFAWKALIALFLIGDHIPAMLLVEKELRFALEKFYVHLKTEASRARNV